MRIRARAPLYVVTAFLLTFAVLKAALCAYRFPFVLNLSASMPRGIYRLAPLTTLVRGEVVLFLPPQRITQALRGRRWLDGEAPLLKPVGAIGGDVVCVSEHTVYVNGRVHGEVFRTDTDGFLLPQIRGCLVVSSRAFVPLSTSTARSFDGRYFGEIPLSAVLSAAVPILTW